MTTWTPLFPQAGHSKTLTLSPLNKTSSYMSAMNGLKNDRWSLKIDPETKTYEWIWVLRDQDAKQDPSLSWCKQHLNVHAPTHHF